MALPQTTGFLRLPQIIGNPKATPTIPALIPVCSYTCWYRVKSGKYPKPVKIGVRTIAWRVEDINALMESFGAEGGAA